MSRLLLSIGKVLEHAVRIAYTKSEKVEIGLADLQETVNLSLVGMGGCTFLKIC